MKEQVESVGGVRVATDSDILQMRKNRDVVLLDEPSQRGILQHGQPKIRDLRGAGPGNCSIKVPRKMSLFLSSMLDEDTIP